MNGSLTNVFENVSGNISFISPEVRLYRQVELALAVILCILSPITVISNALLLTAIYKDPLRCFRTPMTFFIVGLAISDLLVGLTVEPFFAIFYVVGFSNFNARPGAVYELIQRIGGIIATIAISVSFFVVLALSVCQYVAVTYPHKFKALVSKNRVLCSLAVSSVYITGFCMLQFTGIELNTFLLIDLVMHPTLFSIVLIVVQVLLYTSFNRHLKRKYTLRRAASVNQSLRRANSYKKRHNERQFTIMTFYLTAILLVSASLHNIALYIYLFKKPKNLVEKVNIHICLRVSDLALFIKVALDIFIYAWRLPSYRRALKCTLFGRQRVTRGSSTTLRKTSDAPTVMENGQKETGTENSTMLQPLVACT